MRLEHSQRFDFFHALPRFRFHQILSLLDSYKTAKNTLTGIQGLYNIAAKMEQSVCAMSELL